MIYRSDNRTPEQMRPVNIIPDFISTAEGSVLIEVGNTRVICTATVEESVPKFMQGRGKGWITSEYAMLPRSTLTRTARESTKGRPSGRSQEIQRLIGRSLRAITDLARLGERTLFIDCDVIQADGGTRTASITGAFVAVGLAMQKLIDAGTLTSAPLRDFVAATSVGHRRRRNSARPLLRRRLARRSGPEFCADRSGQDRRSASHRRTAPLRGSAASQNDGDCT